MREVTGSSPVVSTKKTHPFVGVFFGTIPRLQQDLMVGAVLWEQNALYQQSPMQSFPYFFHFLIFYQKTIDFHKIIAYNKYVTERFQ